MGAIAAHIGATIVPGAVARRSPPAGGVEVLPVRGVASLANADQTQITFLSNKKYRQMLADSSALAVIVAPAYADDVPFYALVHNDPYAAFAALTQLFETRPGTPPGIDASAVVANDALLGKDVCVGPGVVIHSGAAVGDSTELAANVVVESGVRIGERCYLGAGVTLCHAVELGDDVRIQSGSVIGAEGFGYAPLRDADEGSPHWRRIAQLGTVRIGDRVEIGANTTVDRGALDDTRIGNDVIIDNQVQVAHNVRIGSGTAIAGCVGIAGSAIIGRNCNIGGGVGIAGHLSIVDGVSVLGMSLVNRSIGEPGVYASGSGLQEASSWRKSAVRFTQLESLNKRVKQLEQSLKGEQQDD
ncbi:MAG: UDP-3-O-(3-hydroxymyristoyl)glucosamine N-acyltransferase [Gammaproteobacteria bacterium]|nr:UDP-3-O-(3-hydroxymyristoyl)glucosamine N-acyltransferase [Gammaproteobacteria bacterium]NND39472.1 UDP-3-O-(3-hydroxymyristoyl)glucosamine N-acyltransferase [Pseudomonadales bacterium]NNL10364.1 UDP-3-O-(3-hydroxymyristoyl)glucosamine N-acyltransferase [Pseudomonadales bacterium]NNM12660.1 UDP-3-O-(3-hydroxymyristoyl)glucosamine N-acyltransferase [Pseudomonadales bacterium]RZV54350.1 MAG: UDP-3-O-(3-hydroxymyristoyl)glucosamine N-acyltransferase [Pseudomonadales bacterium]